jgi:hypothetical protein
MSLERALRSYLPIFLRIFLLSAWLVGSTPSTAAM